MVHVVKPSGLWFVRLAVTLCAGALLLSAVVVGAAPQVWDALHAHEEEPITLVAYGGLASRTRIVDAQGQQIGVFEFENSQPISISWGRGEGRYFFPLVRDGCLTLPLTPNPNP